MVLPCASPRICPKRDRARAQRQREAEMLRSEGLY
jgi:hypothetical protein